MSTLELPALYVDSVALVVTTPRLVLVNAPAPAEKRASEALVAGLADTPIDPIDIDDGYLGRLPEFIGKEQTSCSDCGFTSNVPALIAAHDFGHTEDT